MQIDVEEKIADLLTRLRAQAAASHMSFDSFLEQFVVDVAPTSLNGVISIEEFDRILDDLAASPPGGASLPADFSRVNIYSDHD